MSGGTPSSQTDIQILRLGSNGVIPVYVFQHDALLVTSSHRRLKSGAWSGGGPFFVYKRSANTTTQDFQWLFNGVHWNGTMGGGGLSSIEPTIVDPNADSELFALSGDYATGYRRTRPGNPVADAGQFFVELRDLPHVPLKMFRKLKFFRALGSEYLNAVFGWKPFVNDLRKMYNLQHTIDKRMAQIIRENGRSIHRKATIENDTSSSSSTTQYAFPFGGCTGAPPNWRSGGSSRTITTKIERRKWFVGRYQYYIPDVGSSQWDRRARLALFGALPTPAVIWEVLPWSWLIDWFSNVGDIISNASTNAVDNLTCQYSFIMASEKTTTTYSHSYHWTGIHAGGFNPSSIEGGNGNVSSTFISETKARNGGGNPFGLNVTLPSLSAYQLGILAALGISRQRLL